MTQKQQKFHNVHAHLLFKVTLCSNIDKWGSQEEDVYVTAAVSGTEYSDKLAARYCMVKCTFKAAIG